MSLYNPELLITYKRWDIVIKYVYIKYLNIYMKLNKKSNNKIKEYLLTISNSSSRILEHNLNNEFEFNNKSKDELKDELKDFKWFQDLYIDHIRVLNGGFELKTYFQTNEKNNPIEFLLEFHKLYFSILDKGFNKESKIPITHNKIIINGAHRIAITSLLKIPITIQVINHQLNTEYPPQAFEDRKSFSMPITNNKENNLNSILNQLTEEQQNFLLREYILLKYHKLCFLVIYNLEFYINNKIFFNDFIKNNDFNIVYQKNIKLTNSGSLNFIRLLFSDSPQTKIMLKYALCYPYNIPFEYTTTYFLLEKENGNIKSLLNIEEIFKKQKKQLMNANENIYFTINSNQTIKLSNLFFHKDTLNVLNNLPFFIPIDFSNKIHNYLNHIKHKNLDLNNLIITDKSILELFDVKKNDIDNKENIKENIKENNKIIELININEIELEKDKIINKNRKTLFELIYNPNNYFY